MALDFFAVKADEAEVRFLRPADAEERAYSEILRAIITQKYAPGDRLTEAQIAGDLDMSRTPVRNALKKMTASGMLEHSRNIGCRIPLLTPPDMESVFSIRATLEGRAAHMAAERAAKADAERFRELLEREKYHYSKGETTQYTQLNEKIHAGIASLSGNAYLERFVSQLFWRAELYIIFFDRFYDRGTSPHEEPPRDSGKSRSCREHEAIVSAIADGDPEGASAAIVSHINSTYETITRRRLRPHAGL